MKKFFFFIALATCACHKSVHQDTTGLHYLGIATDRMVKLGQAVTIYDSTALVGFDSLIYFHPPTDRIYIWSVTNNDSCATFSGPYKNGRANIIFHCPGIYKVTSSIYDSLTNHLLGRTDTVEVSVSTDTLFPAWQIQLDDTLIISPSRGTYGSTVVTHLSLLSARKYDYDPPATQMKYTVSAGNNSYNFDFTDSIYLLTYPFVTIYPHVYEYGVKNFVHSDANISDLELNVPANISVYWLGQVYQGTLTRVGDNSFVSSWDNSGAVRMIIN